MIWTQTLWKMTRKKWHKTVRIIHGKISSLLFKREHFGFIRNFSIHVCRLQLIFGCIYVFFVVPSPPVGVQRDIIEPTNEQLNQELLTDQTRIGAFFVISMRKFQFGWHEHFGKMQRRVDYSLFLNVFLFVFSLIVSPSQGSIQSEVGERNSPLSVTALPTEASSTQPTAAQTQCDESNTALPNVIGPTQSTACTQIGIFFLYFE